jgi:hypothetical protein
LGTGKGREDRDVENWGAALRAHDRCLWIELRSFLCSSAAFESLPSRFCVLGLFGFPCQTDDNCLVGTCQDVLKDIKACSVPCATNTDCAPFGSKQFAVHCVNGQCLSTTSLLMRLLCDTSYPSLCPAGTECLTTETGSVGFCSKRCTAAADCAGLAAGRLGYGCLRAAGAAEGLCYPGFSGVECSGNADCLEGLECDPALGNHCTPQCQSDAECQQNRWMDSTWRCQASVCTPT